VIHIPELAINGIPTFMNPSNDCCFQNVIGRKKAANENNFRIFEGLCDFRCNKVKPNKTRQTMKTSDFYISRNTSEASYEFFPISKVIIWANFIVFAVMASTVIL